MARRRHGDCKREACCREVIGLPGKRDETDDRYRAEGAPVPASCHFWLSALGSQHELMRRATVPRSRASMISPCPSSIM